MKKIGGLVIVAAIVAAFAGPASSASMDELVGQRRFEGVTLNIPSMAGWRCVKPIWDREALFTEKTGAKWIIHGFPHVNLYPKEMAELVANTGAFDLVTGMQMSFSMFEPYLISLNPFIERDFGSLDNFKKLFYPSAMEEVTYNGQVKYVPYQFTPQFTVYREDLFNDPGEKAAFKAQYGYELEPPETIQQLIDVAKFFTRPEEDLWGLVFMGKSAPGGWTMISAMYGAGLDLVDPETGKAPFASGPLREKAIEAASFWYDMVHTYKVSPPGSAAIGHTECYEVYAGGHAAMSHGWWSDFWDRVTAPEVIADIGESGSISLPTIDPDEGVFLSCWGYGIPKMSKNSEAAWEFIKFMMSEEIALAQSRESGTGIAQPKVNEEAIEKGWLAPANEIEIPRSRQTPNLVQAWAIADLYWTYAPALYAGDLTPEQFVDTVAKKTEEIMR